jgi:hypothetical protein
MCDWIQDLWKRDGTGSRIFGREVALDPGYMKIKPHLRKPTTYEPQGYTKYED